MLISLKCSGQLFLVLLCCELELEPDKLADLEANIALGLNLALYLLISFLLRLLCLIYLSLYITIETTSLEFVSSISKY